MALFINNNMMALRSALSINQNYNQLAKSTSRLSSGLRIQGASDDGADFALREFLKSDIASLHQGMRNANDGISMIQVADGALQVIDEKLLRMKELAEQAATGTYDSTQRAIIEVEYQQMASEITRIANATDFNGIKLLDGNLSSNVYTGGFFDFDGKLKVHFGTGNSSSEDFCFVRIDSTTASSLGVGNQGNTHSLGYTVSTQEAAGNALVGIHNAIQSKDTIRASLGAMQTRLEATVDKLAFEAENTQAFESYVSDIDVADEMTLFMKQQMLAQSAIAMMTQANATPKMALQLLK